MVIYKVGLVTVQCAILRREQSIWIKISNLSDKIHTLNGILINASIRNIVYFNNSVEDEFKLVRNFQSLRARRGNIFIYHYIVLRCWIT